MTNNRVIWSCFGWKISVHVAYFVFVCCAMVLCLSLAYWQWQRAQAADLRYSHYLKQSSQPASPLSDSPQDYQKVSIAGEIKKLFFLDNQIYQGSAGRHVLAAVQTNQSLLLVNLGWQPKQAQFTLQDELPQYIAVQGLIKKPQPGFMLQAADQDPVWPQVMQQVQIPLLNDYYGYQLSPFVLHTEAPVAGLIPVPLTMENKYPMHLGYAIQWLLIAGACLFGFIYVCQREQKENE
ncbi:SURF1 family protein [Methylophaga sp. OBS4]|nr:SURF1 family protein [Methylophaga sp. OBS4]